MDRVNEPIDEVDQHAHCVAPSPTGVLSIGTAKRLVVVIVRPGVVFSLSGGAKVLPCGCIGGIMASSRPHGTPSSKTSTHQVSLSPVF